MKQSRTKNDGQITDRFAIANNVKNPRQFIGLVMCLLLNFLYIYTGSRNYGIFIRDNNKLDKQP